MNLKRIVLAGLAVDVVSFLVALPSYKFFGWVFELEPSNIWRWTPSSRATIPFGEFSAGEWLLLVIANTALAIFIVFLYAQFFNSIPGTGFKKGLMFGLLMFPIGVLIPVFSVYFLMNVAVGALIYLALEGLFEFLIYGLIVALIYK